jgi:hypothetical protein
LYGAVVAGDGPIDGDAVGATGGGLLVVVLARLDIRERVRRRGRPDVEQIRWRRALRRKGRSRRL